VKGCPDDAVAEAEPVWEVEIQFTSTAELSGEVMLSASIG